MSEVNFITNEARVEKKVPEFLEQQPTLCLENGTEFPGSPLELPDELTSSDHSWEFVDQDVSDLPSGTVLRTAHRWPEFFVQETHLAQTSDSHL